jgi:hypothetical protein
MTPARAARSRSPSGRARAHGREGRGGVLAAAMAAAGAFLLEPADPPLDNSAHAPAPRRPVIAVFGLARGCGSTVVARALALELAARDPAGAAVVACDARATGVPLAAHGASHLAGALVDLPGATARAIGRLCLVTGAEAPVVAEAAPWLAPVVLDAGSAALGGVPASVADRAVLVTSPAIEPALARVAAECLARVGPVPILALNRARGLDEEQSGEGPDPVPGPWLPGASREPLRLPESRLGARLALGGREARGELGRAIAELADRCEEAQ